MNDLAICKRIAEIEGVDFLRKGELSDDLLQPDVLIVVTRRWDNGGLKGFMEYNPLTDDDILSKLIVKHRVIGWKKMTEREICLAIIEAHK